MSFLFFLYFSSLFTLLYFLNRMRLNFGQKLLCTVVTKKITLCNLCITWVFFLSLSYKLINFLYHARRNIHINFFFPSYFVFWETLHIHIKFFLNVINNPFNWQLFPFLHFSWAHHSFIFILYGKTQAALWLLLKQGYLMLLRRNFKIKFFYRTL